MRDIMVATAILSVAVLGLARQAYGFDSWSFWFCVVGAGFCLWVIHESAKSQDRRIEILREKALDD